ncbi:MAG: bifunctional metallophosphatase/5'-nucleotidase [Chloroflexi bacterium]|nr:bifunctional metallophosphatase/5'-nucleotidase [Chloroflexota bacterium]
MKGRFSIQTGILVLFLLLTICLQPVSAAEGDKVITILATSDLHSNIWGFSFENNKETENNGMARVYTYVQEVRAENPNTILIDAGDTIQGTILTDDLYNKEESEHPVIAAMNFMEYDVMTIGNHEFNFGLDLVKRLQEQADFPFLAANVIERSTGSLFVGDFVILERDGVKVAIIGVTNPNAPIWDGEKVESLQFDAVSDTVSRVIEEIGDQADVIIVSCHTGLFAEFDEEGGSDAAQKILDENPEVDVLQVAHMHIIVNEKQGETVIGGTRNAGRDVARFDLTLNADNEIIDSQVAIVDMADYAPSAELRALPIVKEAQDRTVAFITGGGSGEGSDEGYGVFGTAAVDFQPKNEINGIPQGKLEDTAVMDLINKVQLMNSGADVSAAALFADTSDIKAGEITYGTIFGIYKFDNTLYRVPVTGKELKAYMEWSAETYNQWQPGDLSISFDPEYPGYLYDMFAGVDYEIDLSKPKGERIQNVLFKGEPLEDDQQLTLAVNNYRYSSALKSAGLVAGKREWESSNSIRDMLVAYISEQGTITPEVDNNWKIVGVDLQLDNPMRTELIDLVNAGLLEPPYADSLNIEDGAYLMNIVDNVSMNGADFTVASVEVDGTTYYRLQDFVGVFENTRSPLILSREFEAGAATEGAETPEPFATYLPTVEPQLSPVKLTLRINNSEIIVDVMRDQESSYYMTAGDLSQLWDAQAVEQDGQLLMTVP